MPTVAAASSCSGLDGSPSRSRTGIDLTAITMSEGERCPERNADVWQIQIDLI